MPRPLTDEERVILELSEEEQEEEQKVEEVSFLREMVSPPPSKDFTGLLPLPARIALSANTFKDSLYGSTQATIGDFQETRARRQEGKGHDDYAKELRERADLNEQQANEAAYQAKYGEEGWEQFKNLNDPEWWASTIGEVIPGSAPFLAGAGVAGGAAFMATGNPYAALAAAAVGGGSVVFAQSYGDAYYEYLEKYPDDEAGADRYALKKSGISAIINAASVPAGLAGLSKPILEHYIKQAILQGGIGGLDTVSQNIMVKNNIDPNLDISTGLVKSVVGEAIGEGTVFATAGRLTLPNFNEFQKQFTEEERSANDKQVDALTQAELQAIAPDLDDLDANQLKELIDANPELELGVVIPGESRESLRKKFVEAVKAKNEQLVIKEFMVNTVLSNFSPEQVYNEQKAAFDALTDEELDAYILEEFGTPEAYARWASRQGEDFSFIPGTTATREEDRVALANAAAQLLIRERKGPLWKLGINEFRDYVDDVEKTYTIDELKVAVEEAVPGVRSRFKGRGVDELSKSELANTLAEQIAIIELQRQVRDKNTNRTRTIELTEVNFDEEGKPVPFKFTPQLMNFLNEDGPALRAELILSPDEDVNPITVGFERRGIKEGMSLAEQAANRGAELSVFKVDGVEVTEDSPFFNKTLDEVVAGTPNIDYDTNKTRLSSMDIPLGLAPQFQTGPGAAISTFFSTYIRPLMPTGLLIGSRIRQKQGNIRALEHRAQRLGLEVEQAIAEAVRRGDVKTKAEADKLIMAFLQQTGARIELNAEEKRAAERTITELEQKKIRDQDELSSIEMEEINNQIEYIEGQLRDIQSTKVAARQLPDSLRKAALKVREGIDAITNRFLNEIPEQSLDPNLRSVLQHNLNTYVTRSYKFFSPNLGWNPKAAMLIESIANLPINVANRVGANASTPSTTMTDLYNRAIVSMEYKYRNKMPDYRSNARQELGSDATEEQIQTRAEEIRRQKAQQAVDEWIDASLYKSATSVSNLANVLKGKPQDKADIKVNKLLTQRGEIPYAVRQLLGEITEPELIAATSFARMARAVENATFLQEVKRLSEMPGEMWFSPSKTPEYNYQIDTEDDFNPLEGLWTTKTMAEALSGGSAIGSEDAILNTLASTFGTAKAITQYGIIVLSPGTQFRNIYGAAIMYGMNGHFRTKGGLAEAARLIGNDLFGNVQYNPETGEVAGNIEEYNSAWEYLQRLGIVNTEVRANDALGVFTRVANSDWKTINEMVNGLYALKQTGPGKAFDTYVLSINRGARRTYAASDDFFKILAFLSERRKFKEMISEIPGSDNLKLRVLRDFAKTLKTKSGITEKLSGYVQDQGTVLRNVTDLDKYVDHISAYMVRNGMPNYDYTGKFAEYYQNLPIGNFIAFPTEISRTTINSAQLSYRLGTYTPSPEVLEYARQEGVILPEKPFLQRAQERLIGGYVATHGLVAALSKASQIVFNVDDDEVDAFDQLVPFYQKGERPIYLGKDKVTPYLNTNYFFPYEEIGKFFSVINASLRENQGRSNPDALRVAMGELIAGYTESYRQESISGKLALDLIKNQNDNNPRNIKPIWNENDDLYDQFLDGFKYAMDQAGPGAYRQINDVIWSLQEEEASLGRYGKRRDFVTAAARLFGFAASDLDPDKSIGFIIDNHIKIYEQVTRQNLNRQYSSAEKLTDEDTIKDWEDAQRSFFDQQQDIYFELQALKAWGVDEDIYEERVGRFIAATGVSEDFYENIEKGIFTAWPVPSSTINNYESALEKYGYKNRTWPEAQLDRKYDFIERKQILLTGNYQLSRNLEENLGLRDLAN